MHPLPPLLSIVLLGALLSPAAKHPGGRKVPLSLAVSRILADPGVSQAHWGISVVSLTGTPIYSLNDKPVFQPGIERQAAHDRGSLRPAAQRPDLYHPGLKQYAPVGARGRDPGRSHNIWAWATPICLPQLAVWDQDRTARAAVGSARGHGRPDRAPWRSFGDRRYRRRRYLVCL